MVFISSQKNQLASRRVPQYATYIGYVLVAFWNVFFSKFLGLYIPAPSISDHFPTCKFAIFVPNILATYNFSENFHSKLLPTLTQLENYVGYISGLQHTFPVLIKVLWIEQCCGSVGGTSHFTVNITFFFPGPVSDYLLLGLLAIGIPNCVQHNFLGNKLDSDIFFFIQLEKYIGNVSGFQNVSLFMIKIFGNSSVSYMLEICQISKLAMFLYDAHFDVFLSIIYPTYI